MFQHEEVGFGVKVIPNNFKMATVTGETVYCCTVQHKRYIVWHEDGDNETVC